MSRFIVRQIDLMELVWNRHKSNIEMSSMLIKMVNNNVGFV